MAKKKEVIITCNATNVKAVIEGLERGMAALAKEEENLLNVIKQRGYAENDEKKRLKELENAMDAMRTNIQKNREEQKKLAEVMKDLSGAKLKDLKKALQEGKAALNNMSERDPKRKQLVDDLKRIEAQINKNTGATNKLTGAQKGFSGAIASTAKNLATYMIGFAGFNKVKGLVEDVFRSNLKLSDSLANIRKVSGLSSEAINDLYRNIAKIDSRNTIETLNQLAYTGAKLGIGQNYGVQGLTGFVKAAEQVQMALGEDMGEKALPDLSKMVEVMGLIPKYGVEQSMQKAASAIFQLGATSTATGTNIVEFSKRLYGLANVSRISTQDLLALGSASDAMGLMPEVSATAFNKLFTSIQRQHNLIEQSLGMTKGRIKELYDEGKTMDAIVEIFERMNQKGNLNLLGNIFEDLGSAGARLVNVMATMADRADILRKHLQTSRDAFKEGEAVIGEYMIQNQTAAALVERASNLWAKAFTNPEGVDMVKEMAQAWYDLSKQMTQSEALMESLHSSIGWIATGISTLIKLFPVLLRFAMVFVGTLGLRGIGLAIMNIGGLITAFRTLTKDIMLASGAAGTLNVVLKSNALFMAASAIITAITLVNDYSKAADEAAKREAERQAKLKAAFDESKEAVENVVKPLERYKRILEEGNLSEKQKLAVIRDLNRDYQEYLDYLGIEINSAEDLAKAYAKVVDIMRIKKAAEERDSFLEQKNGENRMSRIENQAKVESAARSFGLTDVDKQFLEKNQHLGTNQLYRQLIEKKMGAKAISQDDEDVTFIYIDDKLVNAGTQFGPRAKKRYKKVGSEELYDAINDYIRSFRAEQSTKKEVYDMFDSEYTWTDKNGKKRVLSKFNMDEYNNTVQKAVYKRKGSLENEKPDKDAIAAAKKAEQDRKKALKLEMDEAQKASTGIISKLEEYYRLQEAAIQEARADGQLTEEQAKEMVRVLSILKNESLATVRRAVTTGETKDWDELKTKVLPTVLADTSEVSQNLLETIQQVSVQKLHDDLKKFNGDQKTVLGLDSRAFFDQMNAKAAGNTREAARLKAKLFNDAEKMVKQYRIYDQAVDRMRDDVEQMGFITETYEQFAERMRKGIEKKPVNVLSLTKQQQQARQQMTDRFNTTQGVGSSTPDDMGKWFKEFTDNGKEEWMRALPELQKWVLDTDKYKDEINNLYELLKKVQRGESIQMTSAQMAPTNAQIDQAVGTRITDQEVNAAMGFKFLGQGAIPYRINIENADEALQWMRQFGMTASGELEVWAQAIPRLREMLEPMQRQDELLKRQVELKEKGKDLTTEDLEELKKIPDTQAEAIPQIQALYYKMDEFANKIPESIKKQVEMMTSRNPIGIDEIRQQGQRRVAMTEQFYDEKIAEANNSNSPEAAAELERQKQQAIFDIKEEYRQKEYQIQEQMGVTWQQQYENELAMYQNMLNKKLISEEQFQKKRGQLQAQLGLKYGQYYNGLMSNLVDALQDYEITSVEAEYDAKIAAARENGQDTAALEEEKERKIMETRKKYAALQLAVKISEIIMNTAAGIMMAYATLPTPAAIAATALISATGAAQLALAKAEYDKVMAMSVSSSKSSSTSSTSKTKLVSGMLTYDKGNVSSYAAPSSQQKHRYLGTDGRVYTATEEPAPQDGLITRPIATTVQGQPALVAENGPEIVIGRETTKAIMMNEPELIRYLANYQHERTRRLYDSGTMPAAPASAGSAAVPAGSPAGSNSAAVPSGSAPVPAGSAPVPDGSPSGEDATAERQALISRLDRSDELMSQVLYFLQNPVAPEIAMYDTSGKKGLHSRMKEADSFMARYGG